MSNEGGLTWLQVSVQGPDLLSGESVTRLVAAVCDVFGADVCVAMGEAWLVAALVGADVPGGVAKVRSEELLPRLRAVRQVDWGLFMFFEDATKADVVRVGRSYREAIGRSTFAIRAADNTWFYLYCRDGRLLPLLQAEYAALEIRRCPPENFDILF